MLIWLQVKEHAMIPHVHMDRLVQNIRISSHSNTIVIYMSLEVVVKILVSSMHAKKDCAVE